MRQHCTKQLFLIFEWIEMFIWRCFRFNGLWAGTACYFCRASRASTARKMAHRPRAWAEGQARRPMRHGPQGTACLHGPIAIVPCRAGPARCPGLQTRRERQSWEKPHVHEMTFPFAPTSFRHGIFPEKKAFVTDCFF